MVLVVMIFLTIAPLDVNVWVFVEVLMLVEIEAPKLTLVWISGLRGGN